MPFRIISRDILLCNRNYVKRKNTWADDGQVVTEHAFLLLLLAFANANILYIRTSCLPPSSNKARRALPRQQRTNRTLTTKAADIYLRRMHHYIHHPQDLLCISRVRFSLVRAHIPSMRARLSYRLVSFRIVSYVCNT